MRDVYPRVADDIQCAICSDANVLISGGTTAGRSDLARRIHAGSARASGPLIVVASSLPDAPCPSGATIFVEEITDVSTTWLMNLVEPAPDAADAGSRVRLISGTRHDLFEQVALNRFEPTLFYRLNVIHILV